MTHPKPHTWRGDEVAVLLAWLDRCVEQQLDYSETIISILDQFCPHRDLDLEMVNAKLRSLAQWRGSFEKNQYWKEIYHLGSAALRNLRWFDEAQRITYRKVRPHLNQYPWQIDQISANNPMQKNTSSRTADRSTVKVQVLRAAKRSSSRLRTRSTSLVEPAKKKLDRKTKIACDVAQPEAIPRRIDEVETAIDSEDTLAEPRRSDPSQEDSSVPNPPQASQLPTTEHYEQLQYRVRSLETMAADHVQTLSLNRSLQDQLEAVNNDRDLLRKKATKLSSQVLQLTQEKENLRAVDRCRSTAEATPDGTFADTQEELRSEEVSLKRQLEDQRFELELDIEDLAGQVRVLQHVQNILKEPTVSKLDTVQEISSLFERIDGMCRVGKVVLKEHLSSTDMPPNLRAELRELLDLQGTGTFAASGGILHKIFNTAGLSNAVCAIFGAAVRRWVFETECEELLETNVRLATAYKAQRWASAVSTDVARAFDYAAVEEMLRDCDVAHGLLDVHATKLADRALKLVAPFFPRISGTLSSSYDHISQYNITLQRTSCERVFLEALKIRNRLLTNVGWYKMASAPIGALFDDATMQTPLPNTDSRLASPDHNGKQITLTLFPSLACYTGAANTVQLRGATSVIPPRNFVLASEDELAGEWQVMTKAVVAL